MGSEGKKRHPYFFLGSDPCSQRGLAGKLLDLTAGYPSGQRGQTVNLLAYAFEGSNPSPAIISSQGMGALPIRNEKFVVVRSYERGEVLLSHTIKMYKAIHCLSLLVILILVMHSR